jgi:hypothetical protein
VIKLITPPGLLVTVALLAIYSAYAFLIGSIEKSWILTTGGFLAVVATYGVAMMRPWSRYLVYLLTVGFFAKVGLSIYEGVVSGFFGFQFGSPREVAGSLLPTLLMSLLSIACCVLVCRHFRAARPEPAPE